MKKISLLFLSLAAVIISNAQWQPVGDRIKTQWAAKVDPQKALPEYPRPIMQRNTWQNLNGLWDYAITENNKNLPSSFDGKILVPFAVESSLSGVQKELGKDKTLWYQRTFAVPGTWIGKDVLLHFGAVDWKADVWVNDVKVGSHTGGYTAFSFDISSVIKRGANNKLAVRVWDPTSDGYQPRGKQVNKPESIWYTAVTGIWQTVWMEPVPKQRIEKVKITPDVDRNTLSVNATTKNAAETRLEVKVFDGDKEVASAASLSGNAADIIMPENVKLWSPESPFLYRLEINLRNQANSVTDKITSYAAMRKLSTKRDENGVVRLQLNNKNLFQFGPLDQGWWPDGLYTAPTDEALRFDIERTKELGFNMIRKHVKVEPERWYYHCDQLGMIVWQDMPSGGESPQWQMNQYFDGQERERSAESEENYRREWKEIMDQFYSYPSIGVWVPFNEAWGQFKTKEIANWTKNYDPTRLVNPASGGNHYPVGDMLDLHHYPQPLMRLYDGNRATVLGEYGGIGYVMQNHLWEPNRNWGYVRFNNKEEVTNEYVKYAEQLKKLIPFGFSAAVYTQTTDVEIEVNGLYTYDRAELKMDEARVKKVNEEVIQTLK